MPAVFLALPPCGDLLRKGAEDGAGTDREVGITAAHWVPIPFASLSLEARWVVSMVSSATV